MFELYLLALAFFGLVLVRLLGMFFARQPIAIREIARTRRKR